MITTIEEISLNAWPGQQTLIYDGWVIRFANGYTKRANSVNPLYASRVELTEKIEFCEHLYREQNLDAVFKLTSASCPGNLDDVLAAKGYRKESPTSVQLLELGLAEINSAREINLRESLSPEWLDAFCRMSAVDEFHRESLQNILLNILPRRCFVSLASHGTIIATGLGVLHAGYIGLFDIVVDRDFRNQGYGQQIVESILVWGRQNGAHRSYLQSHSSQNII